jgi:NADH:ubiquinone oxidoreductase subunit 2 (subunit N)
MRAALGVTALATVVIGIYPEPFIQAVNHAVFWSLGLTGSSPLASLIR